MSTMTCPSSFHPLTDNMQINQVAEQAVEKDSQITTGAAIDRSRPVVRNGAIIWVYWTEEPIGWFEATVTNIIK